jgi:hypothetical protein
MHKNTSLKKGLVIGIIVLFIGIAVTPSINAGITIKKDIQVIIDNLVIETSDVEENCNCEDVIKSNIHRNEELLNKLEVNNNVISILSKHNLETTEKYKELLDIIPKFSMIVDKPTSIQSSSDYPYFLCAMLAAATLSFYSLFVYYIGLAEKYENNEILHKIFYSIALYFGNLFMYYGCLFFDYCGEPIYALNAVLEMNNN